MKSWKQCSQIYNNFYTNIARQIDHMRTIHRLISETSLAASAHASYKDQTYTLQYLFLLLLLNFLLVAPVVAYSSQKENVEPSNSNRATMCVDPDWEPFEFIDENGTYQGIAADLVRLISQRAGIKTELAPTSNWDQSIEFSRAGKCDILTFLNKTPERDKWLIFTAPYFTDKNVFITRVEHDYISNPSELSNETVALPRGTSIEERIRKDYPNLSIILVDSEAEAFQMVEDHIADMTLRSLTMAAYTIQKEGWFNLKIAGEIPGYANQFRIGVSRDKPWLRDMFDNGIALLTPQELRAIINRHISITVAGSFDYVYFTKIAIVSSVLVIVVVLWSLWLRRVNKRLRLLSDHLNCELSARQNAEEHLRLVLDTIPAYIFARDAEGRFILVNKAISDTAGTSPDLLIGKAASALGATDQLVSAYAKYDKEVLEQGRQVFIPEEQIPRKDGTLGWFQVTKVPYKIPSLNSPAVLGVAIDITERKLIEKNLIDSEKKYKFITDNSIDIIWHLDNNYCFTYISPADERLRGFSQEEVLGATIWSLLKPEGIEHVKEINEQRKYMEKKGIKTSAIRYELEQIRKDGSWVWTEINVAPFRDEAGNMTGYHGVTRDITERKNLEEILRKSEERYRILVETAQEGIVVTQKGCLVYCNPMTTQITGYALSELLEMPYLDLVFPDDRELVRDNHIKRTIGVDVANRYHFRIIHKNRSIIWIEISGVVVDWNGEPATMNYFTDVTERIQIEEKIKHMAQHDTLTGLPNRALFTDRLQQAISTAKRAKNLLCVIFIDLDKFKPVNDTYGHNVGDLLLQEVAKRLLDSIRESDTLARVGGDEFVLLLPSIDTEAHAMSVSKKIKSAFDIAFNVESHNIFISSSIGIAIYPRDGYTATELCKNADKAMYYAKSNPVGGIAIHSNKTMN